jgi:hypothetical protein
MRFRRLPMPGYASPSFSRSVPSSSRLTLSRAFTRSPSFDVVFTSEKKLFAVSEYQLARLPRAFGRLSDGYIASQ